MKSAHLILMACVIAMCASMASAQTVQPDPANHPRIFFSEEDIPALREAVTSGTAQWMYQQIIAHCDILLDAIDLDAREWSEVVDQKCNWSAARGLIDLSVAWTIGADERYGELAVDALMKVCTWPTWYVGYEPNRGVLLQGAAVAYDLLFDRLGPERAATVAAKIASEAEEMSRFLYGDDGRGAVNYHSSMAPRTYGPFGVTAIALIGEYPRAEEWAQFCAQQLPAWVQNGFDDQGAFYYASESCYNTLSLNYLLGFYIAWERLTGENLADTPKLRRNVIYQLYRLEPQRDGQGEFGVYDRQTSYESTARTEGAAGCPQNMVGLARLLDDGLARWYYEYVHGPHGLAVQGNIFSAEDNSFPLLWWKDVPIEYPDSSPRLGGALYCEGAGKVVLRTGFESTEDVHFALESRRPSHGHSQADHGNFILNAFGERFIDDSGTSPNYGWGMCSAAHSLVMIDDDAQAINSHGTIDEFVHSDLFDYLRANPEPAYDARSPVRRALRHVVFVRPAYFVIVDDVIKDDQPRRYELLLHSDRHRQIDARGEGEFIMRGEAADLLIHFAAPDEVTVSPPTVERIARYLRYVPADRLTDEQKAAWVATMQSVEDMPAFHIVGTPQPRDRGLFATLLYPVRGGDAMPAVTADASGGAVTFTVGETDTIGFNADGGRIAALGAETDATVFALRRGAQGGWLVVDCTRFSADGVKVRSAQPVTIAMQGASGEVQAAEETLVTFGGATGVELDDEVLEPVRWTAGSVTVRLPAGRHALRLLPR